MNQIRILGKIIDIVYTDDFSRTDNSMGRCDPKEGKIFLKKSMNPEHRREILLHETIHMICENLALELTENQITALSSGLYAVTSDNGLLPKGENNDGKEHPEAV